MSMQLPPVLSNPLAAAGYTVPKPPSAASTEAQLKNAANSALTGSSATTAGGATTATGATSGVATNSATAFHQLLQQALTKTAQGMANNTARQTGLHPDQSGAPTNAQAATGHAVNIIA